MAATTAIIAGAGALASAGLSVGQAIQSASAGKAAQEAAKTAKSNLESLIKTGYENKLKGLQVPTMGTELGMEKQAQREQAQIQALQETGAAGVIGGTGALAQAGAAEELQRAAGLSQQEFTIDKLIAQEEADIAQQKYSGMVGLGQMELGGAQQAAADAYAAKQAALGQAASGLTSFAGTMAAAGNPYGDDDDQTWRSTANPRQRRTQRRGERRSRRKGISY